VESELDVLTCSEAEVGFRVWELESVGSCVGGDAFAVDEFDGDPAVFLEDRFAESVGGSG
jgi:hypothetical protein